MRVLHVIPSIASIRGGTSRAVLDIVASLQKANISAEIATTNDNGVTVSDVSTGVRTLHEGIPVYYFARCSVPIALVREFTFSIMLTLWLWQNIANYDVVHVHALFSYPSTIAMVIARIKGIPYVLSPHGLLCTWSLKQRALKKAIFLALVERRNLNNASAIHLTSEMEATEVSDLKLRSHSFVLQLGIQFPVVIQDASQRLKKMLGIADNAPIVIFMGRLHYKKGLELLISSLERLLNTPFHFVLAGSGDVDYEQQLDRLIRNSSIHEKTYRLGFVSGEQKNALLQGSDIFALTSHSENFGVAVLEALSVGLPVVVTPGVALADMVKKHRFGIVPDLEENAIAAGIKFLLDNPEDCRTMGQKARRFIIENYAWDKIAANLIEVYQTILQKAPLPQRSRPPSLEQTNR